MTFKVFITGVTGYIAGDALFALHNAHPEYEYAALVRTQDKADKVKAAYPDIRIVLGGLDDSETLSSEAAMADVVLHAADASDHEGAARAIAAGMTKGHSKDRPGYWLHTGGTGILTYFDSKAGRLGEWEEHEFNDFSAVRELTELPDEAFHRNVDQIVLEAGNKHGDAVKTAIVCPPTIYGKGRGPVAVRGRQVYELAKLILQKGYAPVIGQGKARWNNVHVADLSDLYVTLTERAARNDLSEELWGAKGYFLAENGEHVWGELSKLIASKAAEMGMIGEAWKESALGKEEAMEVAGFEAISWGLNSRGKAERARRTLEWRPTRQSIQDEVPNILAEEKDRVGR